MPRACINFFSEKITFEIANPRKTANWLKKICLGDHQILGSLNYVFCSDKFLGKLNKQFLNHSTFTDILTFNYSEQNLIQGEIYISIPRVKENAKKYNQPFQTELRRVLAHGILHLLGYNDKNTGEKAQMRIKEEACLSLWK
jgi:probable rRNA maturation factor